MSDLELQKFLRSNSVEELEEQYGIKCSISEEFPELHLFKYSQIDSPMGEKIVQEARGIILNGNNNWSIVARPYDKFFNYGGGHAAEIDWETATVYEKLDGSLITMYWYADGWRIATSGNPDAGGEVWNGLGKTITFQDLFWQTWNKLKYVLPSSSYKHLCFMFELMTPLNKVVVQHKEAKIVLHGARRVADGNYTPCDCLPSHKDLFGWEVCKTYDFNTIEAIVHNVGQLEPIKSEGYIVVDGNFNRIKVKSPQYVALHHMRDTLSPRRMLEVIRANESEEFLNYFEEYKNVHQEIKSKYLVLVNKINNTLEDIYKKGLEKDYKAVGLYSKNIFYQGALFQLLKRDITVEKYLSNIPIKKLECWVELANS